LVFRGFDGKLENEHVVTVLEDEFGRGLNCEKELSDLALPFWEKRFCGMPRSQNG
jgi:hypothetical protein